MEINLSYIPVINIVVIVWLLISIISGYRKGFLWGLLKIACTAISVLLAWIVAPGISEIISIYPKDFAPFQDTVIADVIYSKLNYLIWFIIIYLVVSIALAIIRPLFEAITEIPILKQVNKLLGVLLGVIRTFIYMIIIIYVLNSAIFSNGDEVIENSYLKYVKSTSTTVMSFFDDVIAENASIQKFINDPLSLTDEDVANLVEWLQDSQLTSEEISEFLETYGVDVDTINETLGNE